MMSSTSITSIIGVTLMFAATAPFAEAAPMAIGAYPLIGPLAGRVGEVWAGVGEPGRRAPAAGPLPGPPHGVRRRVVSCCASPRSGPGGGAALVVRGARRGRGFAGPQLGGHHAGAAARN